MSSPVSVRRVQRAERQSGQPEAPHDQAKNALDEARMVLPGIQALFGFQLIAIFSDAFSRLPPHARILHFVSLCLVVGTVALIMTPAAYDRIAEPDRITRYFLRMTSRVMSVAMGVFSLAIGLELVVVGWVVTSSWWIATAVAVGANLILAAMWFAYPLLRDRVARDRGKQRLRAHHARFTRGR